MSDNTLLFDLADWTAIAITGADRKSYLHSFCTNDINKLNQSETCEAFIPNEKGRILGHVIVVNSEDELTLISTPNANKILVPHLTKYLLGVEAEIHDRSSESGLIALIGSNAAEAIGLSEQLENNRSKGISVDGHACVVSRQNMTLQPTYLVSGPRESIEKLKNQNIDAGAVEGTPEQLERRRIEAGFPYTGVDLSDANIVQESARVKATTSFTKGCYLGQEPIARLDAMGHTNKELRGFRIESADVQPGAKILAEEKEVGELTSVAVIEQGQSIGLGVIRIKHAAPGSHVAIVTDRGTFPAEIYWDHE